MAAALELYKYDEEAFCVEHIDNLSTSYLWPDMIDTEETTSSRTVINWNDDSISIPRERRRSGGSRAAMHLKLAGYDLIICANEREENKRAGHIVYRGTPELSIRDKIRDVISFVLGRPIVCYGHTFYSPEWFPSKSISVDAYSISGMMFQLHSLPPYPICSENTRNVLDGAVVQTICSSILAHYDQLDMQNRAGLTGMLCAHPITWKPHILELWSKRFRASLRRNSFQKAREIFSRQKLGKVLGQLLST